MIIEQGRVLSASAGWVEVEAGGSGCTSCGSASACGLPHAGLPAHAGRRVLRLPNRPGARAGDIVDLAIHSDSLATAIGVSYGLPLVGLVLGLLLGHAAAGSAGESLGALLGTLAGFLLARLAAERIPAGVHLLGIHAAPATPAASQPLYFQPALFKE